MKKQNKVLRLTQELLSQPQLITREAFSPVLEYLTKRNDGIMPVLEEYDEEEDREDDKDKPDNYDPMLNVGVIKIWGSLTNKPVMTMCGAVGASYKGILQQADKLIKLGAKTIVLEIDSGGGEAYGCFEAADQFKQMCEQANVSVITYVQQCACSAAYAWASTGNEVYCNPMGETGSIGVLICLMNNSKAMEQEGIQRTFITAGKDKVPFADDGSFKDSFLSSLQEKVDALYISFVDFVAENRPMTSSEIMATEANTYMAQDAMQKGLIDGILTEKEFAEYVVQKAIRDRGVFNV